MQHPFLSSYKSISFYLSAWFVILFAGTFISVGKEYDLNIVLLSNVIDMILFAILILPVWYVARLSKFGQTPVKSLLTNHFSTFAAFIFVVFYFGYLLSMNLTHRPVLMDRFYWQTFEDRLFGNVFLYILMLLIYYFIIYYNDLKDRIKTESELKGKVQEAQLSMLKSQINPHFLFNSLNSISSLTISNPPKAQQMIIKLSDFLRYSISKDTQQMSTLRLEIENITRYLEIEKTRFGERFVFEPDINEESYNCLVPVMILQPLFENAIKHGVYESIDQIKIEIQCTCISNNLIIKVKNNYDPEAIIKKGAGIGLRNIRERLLLTYQVDGLLSTSNQNNVFEVKLIIPQ